MIARSEEDLAAIARVADALPVAIWVARAPGGECVYVNREFERILGLTPPPDATRGNYQGPYGVHLPNGDPYPEELMPFDRAMRAREAITVDDIVVHKHDGTRTFLRVSAAPLLDEHGEISYIVEAVTDISKEVEAERQRAEAARQVKDVHRLQSIGSLAGGIAHDFNNMLAIVKIAAGELRREHEEDARRALIDMIDEVTDSAARLTRSLLGFAGQGKHLSQHVPLAEIVRSVVELGNRSFGPNTRVTAELGDDARTVIGDVAQVEQIVMNLVLNARDAVGEGGEITVRTKLCIFDEGAHACLEAGSYVELTVSDTGPGVDPSLRGRMFEPYVTTKTASAEKGVGLGLATVFGVVSSHGGFVELAGTGGNGTTMRVLLPAATDPPAVKSSAPPPALVHGQGTLLIVDDEPFVRRLAASGLTGLGYAVITASSGREAIKIFRERSGEVSAVLLDMVMPGLDGKATYLALRELSPDVPVLLMTGYALNEQAQEILDLGVKAFLAKPFGLAELSSKIAALIARATPPDGSPPEGG